MQINPLFINTAEVSNTNGDARNFRLDNCSYLFSDIIKVEISETGEAAVEENNNLTENALVFTDKSISTESITQSVNPLFEEGSQVVTEKMLLVDGVTISEVVSNFNETNTSTDVVGTVVEPNSVVKIEKQNLEVLFAQLGKLLDEKLSNTEKINQTEIVNGLETVSEEQKESNQLIETDLSQVIKSFIDEIKSNKENYSAIEKITLVAEGKEVDLTDVEVSALLGESPEQLFPSNEKISLVFTTAGGTVTLEIAEDALIDSNVKKDNSKLVNTLTSDSDGELNQKNINSEKSDLASINASSAHSGKSHISKNDINMATNFIADDFGDEEVNQNKVSNEHTTSHSIKQNSQNTINHNESVQSAESKMGAPTTDNNNSPKEILNRQKSEEKQSQTESLYVKTSSTVKTNNISILGNVDVVNEAEQAEMISDQKTFPKNAEIQNKEVSEDLNSQVFDKSKVISDDKVKVSVSKEQIPDEIITKTAVKNKDNANSNTGDSLTEKSESSSSEKPLTEPLKSNLTNSKAEVLNSQSQPGNEKEPIKIVSESTKQTFTKPEVQSVENSVDEKPIAEALNRNLTNNKAENLNSQNQPDSIKESIKIVSESTKQIFTKPEVQSVENSVEEKPIAEPLKSNLTNNKAEVLNSQSQPGNEKEPIKIVSESTKQIFTKPEVQSVENSVDEKPIAEALNRNLTNSKAEVLNSQNQPGNEKEPIKTVSESTKQILTKPEVQSVDYKVERETSAGTENEKSKPVVNQVVYKVLVKNADVVSTIDKSGDYDVSSGKESNIQSKPIEDSLIKNVVDEKYSIKDESTPQVKIQSESLPNNKDSAQGEINKGTAKIYQIKLTENVNSELTQTNNKVEPDFEVLSATTGKQNILTKSQVLKMFSFPFVQFDSSVNFNKIDNAEIKSNQLPLEMIGMKQALDFKVGQEVGLHKNDVIQSNVQPISNATINLSDKEVFLSQENSSKLSERKESTILENHKPTNLTETKADKYHETSVNKNNVEPQKINSSLNDLKTAIKSVEGISGFVKVEKPLMQKETVVKPEINQNTSPKSSTGNENEILHTDQNRQKVVKDSIEVSSVKPGGETRKPINMQKPTAQREEFVEVVSGKEEIKKSFSSDKNETAKNSSNASEIIKEDIKIASGKNSFPKTTVVNEKEVLPTKDLKVDLTQDKSTSTQVNASENSNKNETKNEQEKNTNGQEPRQKSESKQIQGTSEFKPIEEMKERGVSETIKMSNNLKTVRTTEIVKEIQNIIQSGEKHSVTMKLTPATFGSVKVLLETVNNVLTAKIEVENDTVKQIIQSNVEQLKQSLNENGIQLATINISLSNSEHRSARSQFQKKKNSSSENDKKVDIDSGTEIKPKKQYGYNTYEYLV